MNRPYGMAPAAFDAHIRACFNAGLNPDRVMQTIGNASASKGYHARDGVVMEGMKVIPYCAAVDLRTRDLSREDIKELLIALAVQGFACWYRHTGRFSSNQHIHAIYVGLKMKRSLQLQVIDFLNDRTGLVGHNRETFWTAPPELDAPLRAAFLRANPQ